MSGRSRLAAPVIISSEESCTGDRLAAPVVISSEACCAEQAYSRGYRSRWPTPDRGSCCRVLWCYPGTLLYALRRHSYRRACNDPRSAHSLNGMAALCERWGCAMWTAYPFIS